MPSFDRAAHCQKIAIKHGDTMKGRISPEYRLWANIKTRCLNPKASNYRWYGARGVTVCKSWADSFETFLADVGRRPEPRFTLDRIDNNKGYERGNVRWLPHKENCRNTRRNVILNFNGQSMCVSAWAEKLGISSTTIIVRRLKGWPLKKVLSSRNFTLKVPGVKV